MPASTGKYNKIRQIVRIRQMLQRWRKKASSSSSPSSSIAAGKVPPDVPAGHVAICVGSCNKRYVVRATYLNHPIFKNLLVQAEEEYGFANQGPLALPCHESAFEEILRAVSQSESGHSGWFLNLENFQRRCHLVHGNNLNGLGEPGPSLHEFAGKSVC